MLTNESNSTYEEVINVKIHVKYSKNINTD